MTVGLAQEDFEISQRAVHGMDVHVIGDVITIVLEGRWIKRKHPNGGHAEVAKIIEFLGKAAEVARAVGVAVEERADVDFVDDAGFVPKRVPLQWSKDFPWHF